VTLALSELVAPPFPDEPELAVALDALAPPCPPAPVAVAASAPPPCPPAESGVAEHEAAAPAASATAAAAGKTAENGRESIGDPPAAGSAVRAVIGHLEGRLLVMV